MSLSQTCISCEHFRKESCPKRNEELMKDLIIEENRPPNPATGDPMTLPYFTKLRKVDKAFCIECKDFLLKEGDN
ncbi:MAG: hypothetical protein ACYSTS_19715 [Planctomycetota bacterium]|jgi:hypothetical protein